jgi:hypothetical protein
MSSASRNATPSASRVGTPSASRNATPRKTPSLKKEKEVVAKKPRSPLALSPPLLRGLVGEENRLVCLCTACHSLRLRLRLRFESLGSRGHRSRARSAPALKCSLVPRIVSFWRLVECSLPLLFALGQLSSMPSCASSHVRSIFCAFAGMFTLKTCGSNKVFSELLRVVTRFAVTRANLQVVVDALTDTGRAAEVSARAHVLMAAAAVPVCVCVCVLSHYVHAAIVDVLDLPSLKCSSHWSLGLYPAYVLLLP